MCGARGYDLHITRREDWSDIGNDITAEEWLTYVHKDAELSIDDKNGPYDAIWRGKERDWLAWQGGCIFTKYPSRELIEKMISIAQGLGAKVQGNDGEVYPAAFVKYESAPEPKQSWWGKFFGK